jgi:hypothetical protein
MREALCAWFAMQTARDRLALRTGAVSLAALLLVMLAWSAHERLAARRVALSEAQALLVRASAETAARLAAGDGVDGAATPLSSRVSRALERAGLLGQVVSLRAPSADAAQLELALRDVPFDVLVGVLGGLSLREGITVASAEMKRTSPGRVDASLVMRAP